MSRLSPERLIVTLAPGQLSARRVEGRRQAQLLDQHAIAVAASGPAPWTGVFASLELLLDDPAWSKREINIVLSSHFVRYVILPPGKRLGEREEMALARLVFRNLYGNLANDWTLRISPSGGQARVASGIPNACLAELQAACEGRGTLVSIQPMLMTVYNRIREEIDEDSGILALVEAGRITLATLADGQWQSIASRAAEGSELPALLDEIAALSGQAAGGRLWLCDPDGLASVPDDTGWRVGRPAGAAAWGTA